MFYILTEIVSKPVKSLQTIKRLIVIFRIVNPPHELRNTKKLDASCILPKALVSLPRGRK